MSKFPVGSQTTADLKSFRIDSFGGVDLTNSPLYVASNRASSMKNFIKRNNVNEKRYGWNEVLQFEPITEEVNGEEVEVSSAKINGIWQFDTSFLVESNNTRSYKKEHHIIIHVGKRFYRV